MLIYNAFPLSYANIDEIVHQLPHIKHMGFQAVWLNPIQNNRRYHPDRGGSLYSMTHDEQFLGQWHGGDVYTNEQALERLKNEAKRLGLVLMFDLVMKQVGRQLPKVLQHKHLFRDPYRGEFDYSTHEKRVEIFNIFFKPLIEKYVTKYGFTGMRIDAAGLVPPEMQQMAIATFRDKTWHHYQTSGIVLGEFLESNDKLWALKEQGVQYDLITNSSYWSVNPSPYFNPSQRGAHNGDMGERRQLAQTYGTIGWTGNHDHKTLYHTCLENLPKHTFLSVAQQNQLMAKMMRERIATMAFVSDGGYYLLCGDEFGSDQRRSCFEWEDHQLEPALRDGQTYWHNWGGKCDMVEFIREINCLRRNMPTYINPHYWSEQYVLNTHLDPHHNIKCVVRHNGHGFSGSMDIVFINVDPAGHTFEMDHRFVDDIKQQIQCNHPEFYWHKHDIKIHLAGPIQINGHLPHGWVHSRHLLDESSTHAHKEVAKASL